LSHEGDLPVEPQPELPEQSVRRAEGATAEIEGASKAEDVADGTAPPGESEPARAAAPQQPLRRHGTAKPIV